MITSRHRTTHFLFRTPASQPIPVSNYICILPGTVCVDTIEVLDGSPYAIAFIQPGFHLSPQLLPQQEP
jgi:hypothetical protein